MKPFAQAVPTTILVADDEEIVRDFVKAALERWGFEVLLAENGEEAVAVFQAHADRIGLVFLDMNMPKLDGLKALQQIRELKGDVRALLSSGYHESMYSSDFAKDHAAWFLQKPYTIQELEQIIGVALAPSNR